MNTVKSPLGWGSTVAYVHPPVQRLPSQEAELSNGLGSLAGAS